MPRIMLAVLLLTACLHATAQEVAESAEGDPASPYSDLSDDELVQAFLFPTFHVTRTHPRTGQGIDMDALNELFQRHPEWNWRQLVAWEIAPGMTTSEVLISWGKPRKIKEEKDGQVWIYRTKFPPSGSYLDFNEEGKLERVR